MGKSDAIDAKALARYAQERHAQLTRWTKPDPARASLQTLVHARADFVAQRTACTNRLKAPGAEPVLARLESLRAFLDDQIRGLEADIAKAIPGLGPTSAAALLALMPELGRIGRRQAAALAGLAPHPRQSGASDAYRRTRGGRPEVKKALFMAAMAAARCNATLRQAYNRLIANGKKPILAITALMRRLIVIANARLRDQYAKPRTN